MANRRKCIVCKSEYEYCGHCDSNKKINTWKNNYCSENCRDLFKIVTDYIGNIIDIKTAKERLSDINLNITPTEQINKYIVEILAYKEPKSEITESNNEKDVIVETEVETESIEVERPRRRRRKPMVKN